MDERAAAGRFRTNAKRRLTVLLNVAESLIAESNGSRVERNEVIALKEAFVHACDRYAETCTEDELTEQVCEQLAIYSSEQLQFYIRVVSLCNTPNVNMQDVAPGQTIPENNNIDVIAQN